MSRRSTLVPAALVALVALGACDAAPPRVRLDVRLGTGAPALDGLLHLDLEVHRCGADPASPPDRVALGETAGAELPLVPGEAFSAGLAGWAACEGPCVARGDADPAACVCGAAGGERRVAEACSEWTVAREDLTLILTLDAPAGLCPPARPPGGCPSG